jgi:hypothetical protein
VVADHDRTVAGDCGALLEADPLDDLHRAGHGAAGGDDDRDAGLGHREHGLAHRRAEGVGLVDQCAVDVERRHLRDERHAIGSRTSPTSG